MPARNSSELIESVEAWQPRLTPRQWDVMRNDAKILLLSGPRWSGKSIVLAHKTMMRAWDIFEANIGIVVSSYKVATSGGVWSDIVDAAHEWARAEIESEYGATFEIMSRDAEGNPGSRLDSQGSSRTPMLEVRNKFGTKSTIRLISLDNESEIEKKVKTTRFQFMWIVELSNFLRREVVCICEDQLRTTLAQSNPEEPTYWPDEKCQLVADTNPAQDGKKNWIYRWFYEKDSGAIPDKFKRQVDQFSKKMSVEEIFLEDNTFLPPNKHDDLIGKYAGDPELFQRFVEGIWPDGTLDKSAIFADVFSDTLCIDGYIEPQEITHTLICGWDLGPKNKAWSMWERGTMGGKSIWCGLDELLYVGEDVSIEQFTLETMAKMIAINDHYKKTWPGFKGFRFEHWSDNSSWNLSLNDDSGTEALEVFNVSNGQIELRPVEKAGKSVEVGCQIMRKLMREERFFIGVNMPNMKRSLRNIKRSTKAGQTIHPQDPLKHICDSARYPIFMLEVEEMTSGPVKDKRKNLRTISIPI